MAPNAPWQYYQLVMTQWPTPGSTPSNPGSPKFSIPGTTPLSPVLSSFANVTMETFDQSSIFTGCMNCHNATAHPNGPGTPGNDFLWSLAINAYPDVTSPQARGKGGAPLALTKGRLNVSPNVSPSTAAALKLLSNLKGDEVKQNTLNAKAKAKKQ